MTCIYLTQVSRLTFFTTVPKLNVNRENHPCNITVIFVCVLFYCHDVISVSSILFHLLAHRSLSTSAQLKSAVSLLTIAFEAPQLTDIVIHQPQLFPLGSFPTNTTLTIPLPQHYRQAD